MIGGVCPHATVSVTPDAISAQALVTAACCANSSVAAEALGGVLRGALEPLSKLSPQQLIDERYEKFRRMGALFTQNA